MALRPEGVCARRGRRNFYGGRHNGSHTAQISPDSPRRTESTTEAAVAAGHDLSGRPGGVDEASVSFAAAPASAYASGPFRKKSKSESLNLGDT